MATQVQIDAVRAELLRQSDELGTWIDRRDVLEPDGNSAWVDGEIELDKLVDAVGAEWAAERLFFLSAIAEIRTYGEKISQNNGQTWDALHGRRVLSILAAMDV